MNEHDCNSDCGCCGSDCDETQATVTLTLDDGSVLECAVLTIFPVGENDYIALLPLEEDEDDDEDGDVFLYRFVETDGEPELENIENDDEYESVAEAFYEILNEQEFDEIIDEDSLS